MELIENRHCFKAHVEEVQEKVNTAKVALAHNLNVSNEQFIEDVKELDEFFYSVRNRLRNNFKSVKIMNHIRDEMVKFLDEEVINEIQKL